MKSKLKIIAIALFCFIGLSNVQAQSKQKVGHINSAELLQVMPGRDSAQQVLTTFASDLEDQLRMMSEELERKHQHYLENESSMTQIIRNAQQRELADLQNRIIEFQEVAQEELQNKEAELIAPLLRKAQDAISAVAKERGYTYILDTSAGSVLYFEDADDIISYVKKKLGIQ